MDFSKIRNYLFLGFLLTVTLAFLYVILPFIYPIFWAAVIAAISYPFYQRLNRFLNAPSLSSLLTLILVTIIIILPLTVIGFLLTRELMGIFDALRNNQGQISAVIQKISEFIRENPYTAELHLDRQFVLDKIAKSDLFVSLTNAPQNILTFILMFVLMLYTLFYFIRDGEQLLKKLMYLLPLGDKYEKLLYSKFTSTARATIKGTILVGGIQGILGGLLFYITGIQGALIWGIIMALLSIIPAAGSFVVWLPAGVVMLLTGHFWQGLVILIVGTLLISTIDNILRPILVGKDLQMHPVLILFATLGGIAVFGISGFVIGPVVSALFMSFWQMYEHYYKSDLANN